MLTHNKAAIVPDFDSGIGVLNPRSLTIIIPYCTRPRAGIAGIFKLAVQYNTTPGVINNLTSKYGILCYKYVWDSTDARYTAGVSSCSVGGTVLLVFDA
jgi:hypothetical protein